MRTTARIVADGRITLPQSIRDALGLQEGDIVAIDVHPVDQTFGQTDESQSPGASKR